MADYAAVFLPGTRFTMQASGALTGGDLVRVSGSGTVAKATSTGDAAWIGVAGHDVASGAKVSVIANAAVHESVADGAITAGDQLSTTATANRQVKSMAASAVDVGAAFNQAAINTAINTAVNNARSVIGIALTSAADNAIVRWMAVS